MTKNLKIKLSSILIELPHPRFLMSYLDNISYGIKKLREYSKNNGINLVIGYYGERSAMGDRETLHQILLLEEAEKRQKEAEKEGIIFGYYTLEHLLAREREIREGKYELNENSLIIGVNPLYRKERVLTQAYPN